MALVGVPVVFPKTVSVVQKHFAKIFFRGHEGAQRGFAAYFGKWWLIRWLEINSKPRNTQVGAMSICCRPESSDDEKRERLAVVEEQLAQMHALMTIKDQQVSAASLPPLVQEPN